MIRKIYVGENYSRKVTTPLISTDRNSYKIIWNSEAERGLFKITAFRADGSTVFDYGEIDANGMASYIISSDMYSVEGPLKLFLAIVDESSITTCREINFTVKTVDAEEQFVNENSNPINTLTQKITQVEANVINGFDKVAVYGNSSVYILQHGEDITIEDNVVTKLLKHDFSECEAIAFPDGITTISLNMENAENALVANKIFFPESLRKICRYSLGNFVEHDDEGNIIEDTVHVKVKEYVLNEGLEELELGALGGNIYLEKINIPKSLKTIGRCAFDFCDSLREIFIPATVTKIGDGCFTASSLKQEDATVIYGYAGTEAERYAKEHNWVKEYENTFVNMGSDYSAELDNMKTYIDEQIGLALEGEY